MSEASLAAQCPLACRFRLASVVLFQPFVPCAETLFAPTVLNPSKFGIKNSVLEVIHQSWELRFGNKIPLRAKLGLDGSMDNDVFAFALLG